MARREEKTAATRQRLMEATFTCLVERGYHGTSTVAVCQRAGLARGTMLHHFPSRGALLLASLEDVLTRRAEDFREELGRVNTRRLGDLVRHLWAAVRGPTFVAWLELAVASRTDPVLEAEFRLVMDRFDARVSQIIESSLPADMVGSEDRKMAVAIAFSSLNGLALDRLQYPPDEVEARVDALVRWVSKLQPAVR